MALGERDDSTSEFAPARAHFTIANFRPSNAVIA
jgi:hypothetical protein